MLWLATTAVLLPSKSQKTLIQHRLAIAGLTTRLSSNTSLIAVMANNLALFTSWTQMVPSTKSSSTAKLLLSLSATKVLPRLWCRPAACSMTSHLARFRVSLSAAFRSQSLYSSLSTWTSFARLPRTTSSSGMSRQSLPVISRSSSISQEPFTKRL